MKRNETEMKTWHIIGLKHIIGMGALGLLAVKLTGAFLRPAKVIYGCEGRGDGQDPYLTRRTLLDLGPFGKVCLHTFHRSDADVFHDHPFAFVTLVLSGGYCDVTQGGVEFLRPGAARFRPAGHAHRVALLGHWGAEGCYLRPATTLVWLGPRVRDWGFHLPDGWTPWRAYFEKMGCKP